MFPLSDKLANGEAEEVRHVNPVTSVLCLPQLITPGRKHED